MVAIGRGWQKGKDLHGARCGMDDLLLLVWRIVLDHASPLVFHGHIAVLIQDGDNLDVILHRGVDLRKALLRSIKSRRHYDE